MSESATIVLDRTPIEEREYVYVVIHNNVVDSIWTSEDTACEVKALIDHETRHGHQFNLVFIKKIAINIRENERRSVVVHNGVALNSARTIPEDNFDSSVWDYDMPNHYQHERNDVNEEDNS